MKIYIASSWKNRHAVEMLTALLRQGKHKVFSFIENEGFESVTDDFEEWVLSEHAQDCFEFHTTNAMTADLVIYVAPSGKDAAAEVGLAWAAGVPVYGLQAKGDGFGLMRKLVTVWFRDYKDLLRAVWYLDVKNSKKK